MRLPDMSEVCPKSNLTVRIVDESGEVIWERGQGRGITSRAYATDGTLEVIIGVLKEALKQAEGQLLSFQEVDVAANISIPDRRVF
jgi:hypothetical protein